MTALHFALQFVSVGLFGLIGIIAVGVAIVMAWSIRAAGNSRTVIVTGTTGVLLLGVAVFLAAVYGWIPGIS